MGVSIRPLRDRIAYRPVARRQCGAIEISGGGDVWCGLVTAVGNGEHADVLMPGDWVWIQPQPHFLEMAWAAGQMVVRASLVAGYYRDGAVRAMPGRAAVRCDADVDPISQRPSGLFVLRESVRHPVTGTDDEGRRVLWDLWAAPQLRQSIGGETWIYLPIDGVIGIVEDEGVST